MTQANYGATKIAVLTLVATAELGRYGLRVDAIAPVGCTRLTSGIPVIGDVVKAPEDPEAFDAFDPKHASLLVACLGTGDCPQGWQPHPAQGGAIQPLMGCTAGEAIISDTGWAITDLAQRLNRQQTKARSMSAVSRSARVL